MADFTQIARMFAQSTDVGLALPALGFHCVEELSPRRPKKDAEAEYSSEIWLRLEGSEYLAVRLDWLGHPSDPAHFAGHNAHVHFESFPASAFSQYLIGVVPGMVRYDTRTGLPSTDFAATHGRLRVER
jgi:hypothetical protein